jgi:hypothetical protein
VSIIQFVAALAVFGVLYRQCIKFALKNAREGHKSKFMTFSLLKIAMTFLFKTSLLSRYQLDWGSLMRFFFQMNGAMGSGDPTTIAKSQCFGLDVHIKTKLLVAAPFIVMLLPLPMLTKAKICRRKHTVFGVRPRDAYWASVLIGWWLLHPAILAHCIDALVTVQVGDKAYPLADLGIAATEAAYVQTRKLAIALLVTFVPAVPLFIFGSMFRMRKELGAGERASMLEVQQGSALYSDRLRFFYFFGSYSPERYYWEGVVFVVRSTMVVLASTGAAATEAGQLQIILFVTTWVALLHFLLVFKYEPYSRHVEDQLNKLTLFVMLGLLLCAMGISIDTEDGSFATVLKKICALAMLGTMSWTIFIFTQQFLLKRATKKAEKAARAMEGEAERWREKQVTATEGEAGASADVSGGGWGAFPEQGKPAAEAAPTTANPMLAQSSGQAVVSQAGFRHDSDGKL